MDERLAEIEARADRTYAWIEERAESVICEVEWLTDGAIKPLVAEVRRLKRENHLLSLSRGVPSDYQKLRDAAEHTGIMGAGLLGRGACDRRSHGTQWGCAPCGIPATAQFTVGGD